MTDNYQFKLKNLQTDEEIKFYHGYGVTETISINAITFGVPGQRVENNIAMNLGGFNKIITFNFILKSDGSTNVSTKSGRSIVTLKEQWNYIMEFWANPGTDTIPGIIQNPGIGESTAGIIYALTIYYKDSDGIGYAKSYRGMIEDIAIEPADGEPFLRGRLTLNVAGTNPLSDIENPYL
jgi:hypothetical protein